MNAATFPGGVVPKYLVFPGWVVFPETGELFPGCLVYFPTRICEAFLAEDP